MPSYFVLYYNTPPFSVLKIVAVVCWYGNINYKVDSMANGVIWLVIKSHLYCSCPVHRCIVYNCNFTHWQSCNCKAAKLPWLFHSHSNVKLQTNCHYWNLNLNNPNPKQHEYKYQEVKQSNCRREVILFDTSVSDQSLSLSHVLHIN